MSSNSPNVSRHRRERRWGRYLRRGLVASVLLHALLFFGWRGGAAPRTLASAAGPRSGSPRAASGGGMRALAVRTPPEPRPIPEPPEPISVPEPTLEVREQRPEPEIEPVDLAADIEGLAPGRGEGTDAGPGTEEGKGTGDGGAAAEGRFAGTPPRPRGLILPPSDRPEEVRGATVAVWVFVTKSGEVAADSTRIEPSTGSADYDARLKRQAAEWVFEPARRGGEPVGAWFRYVITL